MTWFQNSIHIWFIHTIVQLAFNRILTFNYDLRHSNVAHSAFQVSHREMFDLIKMLKILLHSMLWFVVEKKINWIIIDLCLIFGMIHFRMHYRGIKKLILLAKLDKCKALNRLKTVHLQVEPGRRCATRNYNTNEKSVSRGL